MVTAVASDLNDEPISYSYTANGGTISGSGSTAEFDTSGLGPGTYEISCAASDARGDRAEAATIVSVRVPVPAPQSARAATCAAAVKNSNRVSRVCDRVLDDVALRLMYDERSTVAIIGCAGADEQNPSDLAIARARSSAVYLIQKGVAPQRVRVGSDCSEEGRTFEILLVAQGAVYSD